MVDPSDAFARLVDGAVARGPTVVDWGCGQGTICHLLEGKVESYFGYDPDRTAIEYAAAKYPQAKFTAREDELPARASSILLGEVLEHLEAPKLFADKLAAKLEPVGG